ncbi:keratin-associated protein 10-1 [Burkholderia pseudomallei 1655]|nr:keratin-associated protein 10-1 [Burkholderia pseudomallei 1655]
MRLGHVWAPLRCCVSACDGVVRSCCRAILLSCGPAVAWSCCRVVLLSRGPAVAWSCCRVVLLSRGPAAASFGPAGVARRARAARRRARHQYAPPTRCSATK